MGAFFLSSLFPCEVEFVEDRLPQLSVVSAFNGVWEVCFKEFVALEEVTYDRNFSFNDCVETFWAILEDFFSCVHKRNNYIGVGSVEFMDFLYVP